MLKRIFAALLLVWVSISHPVQAETIGLSLPLGGDASELSKRFLVGANLAFEKYGKGHELFIVDDGCDPDIGQLAVDDMAARNVAIATGFLCNEVAIIAANRFQQSQIPLLISGARSIRLIKDREREGWNLWRIAPGDDYQAIAAADFLAKNWQSVPYALVDDGTIYGRSLTDTMRILLDEAGVSPQFSDSFRSAQSTQAGLLRRLQRSGVNAAFVAATETEDLITIAKNLKEFEIPLNIIVTEALSPLPYLEEARDVSKGIMVLMGKPLSANETRDELNILLEKRGIEPDPQIYAGYATIQIAVSTLGNNTRETTQNLLNNTFQTVLGRVDFDENGKNTTNPYRIHVWNGETLEEVE